jgi:sortase A
VATEPVHGAMLHSPPMTAAPRRRDLLVGGFLLTLLLGIVLVLATGVLVPPAPSGPVALATGSPRVTAGALPASAAPSTAPSLSPTPSPSSTPDVGTVATRIIIPRLGINLPIYEGDGYTARLGAAAHYPTTGWPGSGSLVYLYSHARDGNFIALWNAKVGDRIELRLKDGTTAIYVVSKIDAKVPWNDLGMLDPTPRELLRLQTCNSYQETAPRFIVEALPLGSST